MTATLRLAAAITCYAVLAGCEVKDQPYTRALSIELGVTEAQALVVAGTPSRTAQATGDCKIKGGVRELLYDIVTVYFGGLSESIDGTTALCVDSGGRVIDKLMIQY